MDLTQTERIGSARSLDRKLRRMAPLIYTLLVFETPYLMAWI